MVANTGPDRSPVSPVLQLTSRVIQIPNGRTNEIGPIETLSIDSVYLSQGSRIY